MTGRTIQESLDLLNKQIADYIPDTKWEANNHRMLKRLHSRRASLEYALEKQLKKEKLNRHG